MASVIHKAKQTMSPVFTLVCETLKVDLKSIGQVQVFAFGSASRHACSHRDIDILIIYEEDWQPKLIREILMKIDYWDIDITFMLHEEEMETKFIEFQRCIPVRLE